MGVEILKLLIVSQHFYPDNFRINDIAPALVERGHEVTVLTSLPDYATGRVPKECRGLKNRKFELNGVKVVRCFSVSRRSGVLFRALNYFSFCLTSTIKGFFMRERFDAVFCYQTSPVLMANAARRVARHQKIPFICYCLDIWPECVKAWGVSESSPLYQIMHRYSRRLYNSADRVLVSSKPFVGYLQSVNGVDPQKTAYLPQHAEDMALSPWLPDKSRPVHLAFGGNIGSVQNVELMIQAAAQLKKRGVSGFVLDIYGDGTELENCQALAGSLAVQDVVLFHGRVSRKALWQAFETADAFLLTLKEQGNIGLTVPAKLQEYMSGGRVVLACIGGGAAEIIREADCGMVCKADDVCGFADCLQSFIAAPEQFAQKAQNARGYYLNHYTKEQVMSQLEAFLTEAVTDFTANGE